MKVFHPQQNQKRDLKTQLNFITVNSYEVIFFRNKAPILFCPFTYPICMCRIPFQSNKRQIKIQWSHVVLERVTSTFIGYKLLSNHLGFFDTVLWTFLLFFGLLRQLPFFMTYCCCVAFIIFSCSLLFSRLKFTNSSGYLSCFK